MIPKDWKGISIETFVKLYPTFKKGDLTNDEIIDIKIKQLSIIKGISYEDAELCSVKEAQEVKKLLELPLPTKIVSKFKIGKYTYRFNIDANNLKAGGYIGIMNSIKDYPIKNMHVTMFNLATPIKFNYLKGKWVEYNFKPNEVNDRIEDFKQMPISIAYPIAVFFLTLLKNLTENTPIYLTKKMKKMTKKLNEIKSDLKNSDGL